MMLKCSSRSNALSRSFGSCCNLLKPLDLGENSSRAGSNQPFNIENLFMNRNKDVKKVDNKAGAKAEGTDNRFSSLFNNRTNINEKPKTFSNQGRGNYQNGKNYDNNNDNKSYNARNNNRTHNNGNYNNKNKYNNNNNNRRKLARFEFNTGSLQAQNALKSIITKVHSYDSTYKVKYLDPDTKKIRNIHLVDVVNHLDLTVNGIIMIAPKDAGELPLIKHISTADMLKNYNDELAALKEQELISKGSFTMQKILQNRLKVEKKKSAIKALNMQWSISIGDLKNQKKSEIESRLLRGENFNIYVKAKNNRYNNIDDLDLPEGEQLSNDITKNNKFRDEDELTLELKKRGMVLTSLQEILDELPCQYDIKGRVETSLLIPLVSTAKPADEVKTCEVKKSPKAEKAKQRQEKQQAAKKVSEEDLDALYLFKIED